MCTTGGKITTFKWGHKVFDGGKRTMVHIPLMFVSEWRKIHSAPCLAGKNKVDESLRLDVVEIARVA
jgi:hypothetical protein